MFDWRRRDDIDDVAAVEGDREPRAVDRAGADQGAHWPALAVIAVRKSTGIDRRVAVTDFDGVAVADAPVAAANGLDLAIEVIGVVGADAGTSDIVARDAEVGVNLANVIAAGTIDAAVVN